MSGKENNRFKSSAKAEWKKIIWPEPGEAFRMAGVAIAVSAAVAAMSSMIDAGMVSLLSKLVG